MGLGMQARRVGWRFGYEIHQHMRGARRIPFRVRRAQPVGPLRTGRRAVPTSFEVDVDRCTSFLGFSFAPSGWNPLVATLREYAVDPSLAYEASSLARAHELFQPVTLHALLFDTSVSEPLEPLGGIGPDRRFYRYVWKVSPALVATALAAEPRHSPNYSFGPLEPARAVDEFDRLIATYCSIRDTGYRPDTYGHVTGYFIGDDRDHRFVVGSGNHRVAALAVLGIDRMPARLHSHPAAIHRSQLPLWMPEHGGPFRAPTAAALFELLFDDDGSARADRLQLR